MSASSNQWRVGIVGYGEVGRILAEDLRAQNVPVCAYDLKLDGHGAASLRDHAETNGVTLATSHEELAGNADFIISSVTASQAVPEAKPATTSLA